MYSLVGILGLVVFAYIRPQEFVPAISSIPWINIWLILMMGGFYLDWSSGRIRKEKTPLLYWSIIFYIWCFITLGLKNSGEFSFRFTYLTTGIGLSLFLQHALQDMKSFLKVVTVVFVTTMFCVSIAFHQGFQDFQCIAVRLDESGDRTATPDGRSCEKARECEEGAGADEEADYWCEHVGLFGTTSVAGGRVKWRGVLNDPNEITLAAGSSIPYALAFFETKRTILRLLLVLATVVVVAITDVFSQSRGAILIFLTVMGIYFVRKYGIRGAIIGAGMGAPLMMLGGRSGAEADESAEERIEVMADALDMIRANPIFGVGYQQFPNHSGSGLTAHNAYLLSAAELGFFGFWLWSVLIYIIMKMMIVAYKRYANVPGGEQIRAWALALFASFSGTLLGVFFLSWTYHYVLWIYFGVAGGFYTAIRNTDRHFVIAPSRKELLGVLGLDLGLLAVIRVYLKIKGH